MWGVNFGFYNINFILLNTNVPIKGMRYTSNQSMSSDLTVKTCDARCEIFFTLHVKSKHDGNYCMYQVDEPRFWDAWYV